MRIKVQSSKIRRNVLTCQSVSSFGALSFRVSSLGLSGFFPIRRRPLPDTARARSRRDTLIVRTFKMSLCISMNAMCLAPKVRVAFPAPSTTLRALFRRPPKVGRGVQTRHATAPQPIGRARTNSARRYARKTRRDRISRAHKAVPLVLRLGDGRVARSATRPARVHARGKGLGQVLSREVDFSRSSPCRDHPLTPSRPCLSFCHLSRPPGCPRARPPP